MKSCAYVLYVSYHRSDELNYKISEVIIGVIAANASPAI